MIGIILAVFYTSGCFVSLAAGARIIQLSGNAKRPFDYLTLALLSVASWAGFSVITFILGKRAALR